MFKTYPRQKDDISDHNAWCVVFCVIPNDYVQKNECKYIIS